MQSSILKIKIQKRAFLISSFGILISMPYPSKFDSNENVKMNCYQRKRTRYDTKERSGPVEPKHRSLGEILNACASHTHMYS